MKLDKTTLLVVAAAVVGLVVLARWKNAGTPLAIGTSTATGDGGTWSLRSIIPAWSTDPEPEVLKPLLIPPGAPAGSIHPS